MGVSASKIVMENIYGHQCSGTNVCLSNNHVLALWDGAAYADRIEVVGNDTFARLRCWLPMQKNNAADAAVGTIQKVDTTQFGMVRGIGKLSDGLGDPTPGMTIRKSGARTGVTNGKMTGWGIINVEGLSFRDVGVESAGFACKGDSGSAVINTSRRLVGLHFAGEDLPCGSSPRGFFVPVRPLRSNVKFVVEY
jgi:trypsin